MPMAIGKLRHKVTVQSVATSQNVYGEQVDAWEDGSERYASIEPLTGRELSEANQVSAKINHKIRMRHVPGIKPRDRITHGARVFEIITVANWHERGETTVALCVEGV